MNFFSKLYFNSKPGTNAKYNLDALNKTKIELLSLGFKGIKYVRVEMEGMLYPYIQIDSLKKLMNTAPANQIQFSFINNKVVIEMLDKSKPLNLVVDSQLNLISGENLHGKEITEKELN